MSSNPSEVGYVFAEDRSLIARIPWGWVAAIIGVFVLLSWKSGRRQRNEFEDYLR